MHVFGMYTYIHTYIHTYRSGADKVSIGSDAVFAAEKFRADGIKDGKYVCIYVCICMYVYALCVHLSVRVTRLFVSIYLYICMYI